MRPRAGVRAAICIAITATAALAQHEPPGEPDERAAVTVESLLTRPTSRHVIEQLVGRADVPATALAEFASGKLHRDPAAARAALRVLILRGGRAHAAHAMLDERIESFLRPLHEALAARGQAFTASTFGDAGIQACMVARAAVRFPVDPSPERLRKLLADEDPHVRAAAACAVGRLGSDAAELLPALLALVGWSGDGPGAGAPGLILFDHLRPYAYEAIADLDPEHPAAVSGLCVRLRSIDQTDKREAALALGRLGQRAAPAIPRLAELCFAADPGVAGDAATALGMIGIDSSAVRRVLTRLSASSNPALAERAREALGQIAQAKAAANRTGR